MEKLNLEDLKKASGGNLDDYFRYMKELMAKYNVQEEWKLGDYLTEEEWKQLRAEAFK